MISYDLSSLPRQIKHKIALTADVILIPTCLYMSFALRYGDIFPFETAQLMASLWLLPLITMMGVIPVYLLRLSRIKLNALETNALMRIATCAIILTTIAIISSYLLGLRAPRSVPLIFGALFFLGAVSVRIVGLTLINYLKSIAGQYIPVAIYGAGAAGIQLATSLKQNGDMRPVVFVDDNLSLQGLIVAGLTVEPPRKLTDLAKSGRINKVLIAMPSVSRTRRLEVVKQLGELSCEVQMTPSFLDLLSGSGNYNDLKPVTPDELLGRDKVDLDIPDIARTYAGRNVMVTGAGGSIGSEFCRQLLECRPAKIILFELNEFALYSIENTIRKPADIAGIVIIPKLGSVCDPIRVSQIIADEEVDIIFHAAAYKHVPLVQDNALEGVKNNVLGTQVIAQAALNANIDRFILVSTDKAVRPTSVMGATKRMAELIIQDLQTRSTRTKFAMVRFGNVLGSSGSVLPLFRQQIIAGGPVTVTHEEVTRYFMTIPEAARLILLAGAYAEGGDVFLLDMGSPIKIMDLAKRMIELSGRTVASNNKDQLSDLSFEEQDSIAIEVVGLRTGEKLYEEMLISDESITKTPHEKIVRANEQFLSQIEVANFTKTVASGIAENNKEAISKVLERWIIAEEIGTDKATTN